MDMSPNMKPSSKRALDEQEKSGEIKAEILPTHLILGSSVFHITCFCFQKYKNCYRIKMFDLETLIKYKAIQ